MKRFISLFCLLLLTLAAIVLTGCSKSEKNASDEDFLGLQISYIGETVTDTRHTFSPEDFKVTALYVGRSEEVTDFSVSVDELYDATYTVRVVWNDHEELCYVPLVMNIYASEGAAE